MHISAEDEPKLCLRMTTHISDSNCAHSGAIDEDLDLHFSSK